MNYTVAPFELADVKAPCSWSPYVDMFNVWRQCLSFDLPLLDDLFSEYLFAKFQSYRDKVPCSDVSLLHFNQNFTSFKQYQMCRGKNEHVEIKRLQNYTYEECVSANPNITLFTVQKHVDFDWDYNRLHCFLGQNGTRKDYIKVKERLRQSNFWKRRYAEWSECTRDCTLSDKCYNKHLKVEYFNDSILQQLLSSESFVMFCKNPKVSLDFLKTRVTYNADVSLKKRIITLVNPNVRWQDILDFCGANDLLLQSNYWAKRTGNRFTHRYTNYPYLIDYEKLKNEDISCDIISAIVNKSDVPEEVVMSMDRQYYSQFNFILPWMIKCEKGCACSTRSKFRETLYVTPIFSNVDVNKALKTKTISLCGSTINIDYRNGYYIKDFENNIKAIHDPMFLKKLYFGIELFQNPMSFEKLIFYTNVLTPAAIKIQRWYLKHFYRPEGRYVNTVLRNRFNARL